MSRLALTAAASLALLAGCKDSPTEPSIPLLARYVAIGNSITAGFQSGGINDSTQRASFAALIARQAAAPFAYASLGAGCPAPITSLLDALGGGAPIECAVAGQTPGRKRLNNVAVPGADSFDPTRTTPAEERLAILILGGRNQVEKALEATPSFVSIWIGNNDVLDIAITGIGTPTPQDVFEANYTRMVDALIAGGVEDGILIGVADVTGIPLLVPAARINELGAAINFVAGRNVTIDAACATSPSLISLAVIAAIATNAHAPAITCTATGSTGNAFVLDAAEQEVIRSGVSAYNAFIASKAAAVGFAFFDPNPTLEAARARGEIPVIPNTTDFTRPFGPLFSLDGVHPSTSGHVVIANAVIAAMNSHYGIRIRPIGG